MGGGFPGAAFGGPAALMAALAPDGPVYQAGTLSGNPGRHGGRPRDAAALHAGGLRPPRRRRAHRRRRGGAALSAAGVPHTDPVGGQHVQHLPARAWCAITTTRSAPSAPAYAAFFHAMLAQGVHPAPSAYEAWGRQRRPRRGGPGPDPRRLPGPRPRPQTRLRHRASDAHAGPSSFATARCSTRRRCSMAAPDGYHLRARSGDGRVPATTSPTTI